MVFYTHAMKYGVTTTFKIHIYRYTTMTNKTEKLSLDTTASLTNFLLALDAADVAETARFNKTENAIQLLKPLRAQYSTLQDGRSKGKKPNVGELPAVIYFNVIESIYNKKKALADEQKQDFTLNYGHYRDFQVKSLKYYIETGDLLNNKKSTLQERVMIAIDRLEKKLKAEQAKLDKAKIDADKAKIKADKAAADKATTIIEVGAIIDEVHQFMDDNPEGADAIKEELFDTITAAEFLQKNAIETDNKAQSEKVQSEKVQAKTEKTVDDLTAKLEKAKAKAEALARGKAEPKPDLSNVEFSKDCRAEMLDVLESLTKDYSDVELLCLASLIRKRCIPSKA